MTPSSENTSATDAHRWFIRRSESWPTWAAAGRRASSASASTIGWKLPLLSIRPDAMSTSGLSSIALSSSCTASRRWRDELAERAVDLRPHPERQRVLDRARAARLVQRAAGEEPADARPRGELAGHGLGAQDGLVEDRRVAGGRLERRGEHEVRGRGDALGPLDEQRRVPDRDPVRGDHRQAVLGLELDRGEARRREGIAARHDLAVDLGVAAPDEHLRDRRHVHQVRRADRAGRGHDRVDPRVEQVDERLGHRPARARAAAGDAVEPGGHRGPDHGRGERLADGALVRTDDERLHLAQRLARQRHVALVPEAGVQPVHERRAVHDAVDDRAAGLDHAPRVVVEAHPGAVRDRHQVVERELVRPDDDLRRVDDRHLGDDAPRARRVKAGRSVAEVAGAGHDHRGARRVHVGEHLGVAHRAAGLDDRRHAGVEQQPAGRPGTGRTRPRRRRRRVAPASPWNWRALSTAPRQASTRLTCPLPSPTSIPSRTRRIAFETTPRHRRQARSRSARSRSVGCALGDDASRPRGRRRACRAPSRGPRRRPCGTSRADRARRATRGRVAQRAVDDEAEVRLRRRGPRGRPSSKAGATTTSRKIDVRRSASVAVHGAGDRHDARRTRTPGRPRGPPPTPRAASGARRRRTGWCA